MLYYYSSLSLILILSFTDRRKLSEAVFFTKDTQLPALIIDPEILRTSQTCYTDDLLVTVVIFLTHPVTTPTLSPPSKCDHFSRTLCKIQPHFLLSSVYHPLDDVTLGGPPHS